MQKWEYKVVLLSWTGDETKLNELGQQGWELVSVAMEVSGDAHGMSSTRQAYFRRRISD